MAFWLQAVSGSRGAVLGGAATGVTSPALPAGAADVSPASKSPSAGGEPHPLFTLRPTKPQRNSRDTLPRAHEGAQSLQPPRHNHNTPRVHGVWQSLWPSCPHQRREHEIVQSLSPIRHLTHLTKNKGDLTSKKVDSLTDIIRS